MMGYAIKQGGRGRGLEKQIERALDQLNALPGIMAIRLEVRQARTKAGPVYAKKQPFDYMVISEGGRAWAFDAKECSDHKWYPSRAPQHQKDALTKFRGLGAGHRAAFLVYFRRWAGMPGAMRWIEDFATPADVDSGVAFGWEMFL